MAAYVRDHETELRVEIAKWSERLAKALPGVHATEKDGERFLVNIRAYQQDADHFLDDADLVRSFECVVWAWAWLEIGRDLRLLEGPGLPPP